MGRGTGSPLQAALASSHFDGAPCGGEAWLARSSQVLVGFFKITFPVYSVIQHLCILQNDHL